MSPQPYLMCSHCRESKPVDAFQADRNRVTGKMAECKECRKRFWALTKGAAGTRQSKKNLVGRRYPHFARRLRKLRGKTIQSEFAQRIGVSWKAYQRYESGDRIPKIETLLRIREMFDLTLDFLVWEE